MGEHQILVHDYKEASSWEYIIGKILEDNLHYTNLNNMAKENATSFLGKISEYKFESFFVDCITQYKEHFY